MGKDVGDEKAGSGLRASGFGGQRSQWDEGSAERDVAVEHNSGKFVLMRIADHTAHAGQCRYFFGDTLRVASRDHDFCLRILLLDAPDRSPRILVGGCGDGTRV